MDGLEEKHGTKKKGKGMGGGPFGESKIYRGRENGGGNRYEHSGGEGKIGRKRGPRISRPRKSWLERIPKLRAWVKLGKTAARS